MNMTSKNTPEVRNESSDQHGDKPRRPIPLETWSEGQRERAHRNHEFWRDVLKQSTLGEMGDILKNTFDKRQIAKERDQLQLDFDSGKIDQDAFDKKSARLDRREAMMRKGGWIVSPEVAASFRWIDMITSRTEMLVTNASEKPSAMQSDNISGLREELRAGLSNIVATPINALSSDWSKPLQKGTWEVSSDLVSRAHDNVVRIADADRASSWIYTSPMSQPQNMETSEIPRIPVQPIHSESAQKVAAEQEAQRKA